MRYRHILVLGAALLSLVLVSSTSAVARNAGDANRVATVSNIPGGPGGGNSDHGLRIIQTGSSCVVAGCAIRGLKADITPFNTWTPNANSFSDESIRVFGGADQIEAGYEKPGSTLTPPLDCSHTNTSRHIFVEVDIGNTYQCFYEGTGTVSPGETHTFNIRRCGSGSTTWCVYKDGSVITGNRSPYNGATSFTMPDSAFQYGAVGGEELLVDANNTSLSAQFGTSGAGVLWQATAAADGTGWVTIVGSDACAQNESSDWLINSPGNPAAPFRVSIAAGGSQRYCLH